eukprot:IDg10304t1
MIDCLSAILSRISSSIFLRAIRDRREELFSDLVSQPAPERRIDAITLWEIMIQAGDCSYQETVPCMGTAADEVVDPCKALG